MTRPDLPPSHDTYDKVLEFLDRHLEKRLEHTCRGTLHGSAVWDDARRHDFKQDVLLQIYRKLDSCYDFKSLGQLVAWTNRIARHMQISLWRRSQSQHSDASRLIALDSTDEPAAPASEMSIAQERLAAFRVEMDAFATVDPEHSALLFARIAGKSYREIRRTFGLPTDGAARMKLMRARQRFKLFVGDRLEQ